MANGRLQPVMAQGRNQGLCAPVAERGVIDEALPARRPAGGFGHVGLDGCFIEESQAFQVLGNEQAAEKLAPRRRAQKSGDFSRSLVELVADRRAGDRFARRASAIQNVLQQPVKRHNRVTTSLSASKRPKPLIRLHQTTPIEPDHHRFCRTSGHAVLCTDGFAIYERIAKDERIPHFALNAGRSSQRTPRSHYINTVNALIGRFRTLMQPFCGPASKNLAAYGRWHAARDNADRSHLDALRPLLASGPRTNTVC